MSDLEKRRFKRRRVRVQAGIICRGAYFYESIHEISEGGLLLRVTNEYQVGELIEICFVTDSGDLFEEPAEIVYQMKGVDGVDFLGARFTRISSANKNLIHEMVER
jgi:hypothetical protein